ncbi:MAG: transcriptional repressor LexA [Verrucomicrobiota bacterium]|nr:transcriptional repressor LexA [Verrucomicrobiota bacterium]
MKKLTKKQKSVLSFIEQHSSGKGMPPTIAEIAENFQIKTPSAYNHLRALQAKGYLKRSSKARGLTLLRSSKPKYLSLTVGIPILGRINAGAPLLAEEHVEQIINMDRSLLPKKYRSEELFGLKVSGDSMRDLGIFHDDIVIAMKDVQPKNGDITVALVGDNETTIKSFFKSDKQIELRPANSEYSPQFYSKEEVEIQGVVISLNRTF